MGSDESAMNSGCVYSLKCLEEKFSELPELWVLGSSSDVYGHTLTVLGQKCLQFGHEIHCEFIVVCWTTSTKIQPNLGVLG
jgi:hypothetical protein